MRKSVPIDPKERFTRKRKALKIAKRTLKLLTDELGYVGGESWAGKLADVGEITLRWGERDGRSIHLQFKTIMDKNRKRHPNHQHIYWERVMIKCRALKPTTPIIHDGYSFPRMEIVLEPRALIFTGKTPVTRVKKLHSQLVAGLFA